MLGCDKKMQYTEKYTEKIIGFLSESSEEFDSLLHFIKHSTSYDEYPVIRLMNFEMEFFDYQKLGKTLDVLEKNGVFHENTDWVLNYLKKWSSVVDPQLVMTILFQNEKFLMLEKMIDIGYVKFPQMNELEVLREKVPEITKFWENINPKMNNLHKIYQTFLNRQEIIENDKLFREDISFVQQHAKLLKF